MGRLPGAWQTNCSLVCHARLLVLRPSKLLSTSGTGMSAAVSALTRKYGSAPPADVPRTIPPISPPRIIPRRLISKSQALSRGVTMRAPARTL